MGKADIETWRVSASGSSGMDDDTGDTNDELFSLASAREDWLAFTQYALRRVLSSKTKERTLFLNEHLMALLKDSGAWLTFANQGVFC